MLLTAIMGQKTSHYGLRSGGNTQACCSLQVQRRLPVQKLPQSSKQIVFCRSFLKAATLEWAHEGRR